MAQRNALVPFSFSGQKRQQRTMENIIKRHANLSILVAVLFAQMLGLAVQIKRPSGDEGGTLLIRQWTLVAITPIEKGFVHSTRWLRDTWSGYFYLRNVRRQNEELRGEIERMRLEQVRLQQDAAQARRLQTLLAFKEQYISETLPAQVIGSSGSELSRVIYIDRGSEHGVGENMAVITPDGIVGKVLRAYPSTSQVLLISDQTSGVGAILEKTRLQGIMKGSPDGGINLDYIMLDEKVEPGETVVTSGGDRIYPKGLPLGRVAAVAPGKNMFLRVRVIPAANLSKLEEVLVITKVVEKAPDTNELGPIRASDILAERLPSVPPKPPSEEKPKTVTGQVAPPTTTPPQGTQNKPAPSGTATTTQPSVDATGSAIRPPAKPADAGASTVKQTGEAETKKPTPKPPASAQPNSNPTGQAH